MSIFLCFIFVLSIIFIFLKKFHPSKWNLPPGPRKLPIIGNLHQRGELHPRNLRNFSEKYGPVVLLRFGFVRVVVISSKEAAEEVLKVHDLKCCSRPETAGTRMISYNFKDIGFAPYGEEWRAMRKLSVIELLSMKKLQSLQYIREEENDLCVKKLTEFASTRALVSLKKTLYTLVGSIVHRTAFGQSLRECEFINEDNIMDLVHKSELLTGTSMFSDIFPGKIGRFIDWIYGQDKRLDNAFSELDTFFQNILDSHLTPGRRAGERSDIIDVMVDMMRKHEKDGESFKITTNHIKGMISDLFLAGVSTSVSTMIWAMTELIRNPRVMKKVQDEIRTTLGDKKERITEEDLTKLHYFKLMVKEIFRLRPVEPLLLPRETSADIKMSKKSSRSCLGSMEDIRKVFQRFDKNGDGKISSEELKDVIGALSPSSSPEETMSMMKELDLDGNGFIDMDEFVALFQNGDESSNHNNDMRDLKEAFDLYDLDRNGRISAKELHSVMKNLGEKCSIQDCKRMISKVDADGDGCVNFDEFKKMMTNGGA